MRSSRRSFLRSAAAGSLRAAEVLAAWRGHLEEK